MKKELFSSVMESIAKLTEKQKSELFTALFESMTDKDSALMDLYYCDLSGAVQDLCNEHADISGITNKFDFLSALGFDYWRPKEEFIRYISEKYDYLY